MSRARSIAREEADRDGFDDVLFGTIGVVLLLLVVALAQVGVPEVAKSELESIAAELETEHRARAAAQECVTMLTRDLDAALLERDRAEQSKAELARSLHEANAAKEAQEQVTANLSRQLDAQSQATKRHRQAAKRIRSELEFRDTEVVLCLDGTSSMGDHLLALQSGLLSLSEIGARLVKIRVGVVIYNGNGIFELPLTEIAPTREGKPSQGMVELRGFMELHAAPVSGAANIEGGVNAALAMFGPRRDGWRQHLVLMGDTDTREMHKDDPAGVQASAERVIAAVRAFAERYEDTGVLSLFTPHGQRTQRTNRRIAAFFEGLASHSDRSMYTNDLSQLSATVIAALFSQQRRAR